MKLLTQIKIFQRPSYHMIENDFNDWVREMDTKYSDVTEKKGHADVFMGIRPHTHLSFDSSLQKYILTVVFNIPA